MNSLGFENFVVVPRGTPTDSNVAKRNPLTSVGHNAIDERIVTELMPKIASDQSGSDRRIEELNITHHASITELNKKLEISNEKKSAYKQKATDANAKAAAVTADSEDKTEKFNKLMADLKENMADLKETIAMKDTQLATANDAIESFKKLMSLFSEKLNNMEETLATRDKQIETIKTTNRLAIEDLNVRNKSLEQDNLRLTQEKNRLDRQIAVLTKPPSVCQVKKQSRCCIL